jgi:hypothetical protein
LAKTIQHATQSTVASAVNTLEYWHCTGGTLVDSGTTETNAQTVLRSPGTASNLWVFNTASTSTADLAVNYRINAGNGTQTVTVTALLNGIWEDTTHTDAITTGQKVNVSVGATTGSSKTITMGSLGYLFAATSQTVTRFATSPALSALTLSTTYFLPLEGSMALNTTEAKNKCRQQKAGTLLNLACNVSTASASTTHTLTSRKNAGAGAQTVTCTAATTGWFEDTTHTDTVTAADDWNMQFVTGATVTSLVVQQFAVDFSNTLSLGQGITSANTGQTFLVSVTTYYAIKGGQPGSSGTESLLQRTCRAAFTFSNLTCLLDANTVSAQSNLNFRKNASSTGMNLTAAITASTAGVYTDSTHTDVVTATDKVNHQLITGGTGTSLSLDNTSIWSALAVAIPMTILVQWEE